MKLSLLPAAAVILAAAAACASAPPPAAAGASTAVPSTPSCADLRAYALHRLDDVLAAHRACTTDADCVSVGFGASCFDACSRSVAKSGQPALDAASADIDADECRDFKAQGCRSEVPPCAPPAPVACRQGICG